MVEGWFPTRLDSHEKKQKNVVRSRPAESLDYRAELRKLVASLRRGPQLCKRRKQRRRKTTHPGVNEVKLPWKMMENDGKWTIYYLKMYSSIFENGIKWGYMILFHGKIHLNW